MTFLGIKWGGDGDHRLTDKAKHKPKTEAGSFDKRLNPDNYNGRVRGDNLFDYQPATTGAKKDLNSQMEEFAALMEANGIEYYEDSDGAVYQNGKNVFDVWDKEDEAINKETADFVLHNQKGTEAEHKLAESQMERLLDVSNDTGVSRVRRSTVDSLTSVSDEDIYNQASKKFVPSSGEAQLQAAQKMNIKDAKIMQASDGTSYLKTPDGSTYTIGMDSETKQAYAIRTKNEENGSATIDTFELDNGKYNLREDGRANNLRIGSNSDRPQAGESAFDFWDRKDIENGNELADFALSTPKGTNTKREQQLIEKAAMRDINTANTTGVSRTGRSTLSRAEAEKLSDSDIYKFASDNFVPSLGESQLDAAKKMNIPGAKIMQASDGTAYIQGQDGSTYTIGTDSNTNMAYAIRSKLDGNNVVIDTFELDKNKYHIINDGPAPRQSSGTEIVRDSQNSPQPRISRPQQGQQQVSSGSFVNKYHDAQSNFLEKLAKVGVEGIQDETTSASNTQMLQQIDANKQAMEEKIAQLQAQGKTDEADALAAQLRKDEASRMAIIRQMNSNAPGEINRTTDRYNVYLKAQKQFEAKSQNIQQQIEGNPNLTDIQKQQLLAQKQQYTNMSLAMYYAGNDFSSNDMLPPTGASQNPRAAYDLMTQEKGNIMSYEDFLHYTAQD